MSLELKIEGLRARGHLTEEERDQLLQALQGAPPAARPRARVLAPHRLFMLGVLLGIAIAYLIWGLFR
jgi:hypothetical protein